MRENTSEMLNAAGCSFGDQIREYRLKCGMTQEKLGALVRVKKNAVGAWEAGRSRPDLASVPKLCKTLGIPLPVFFGLQEPEDPFRITERFERLTPYNRKVVLRQMDMLYELQAVREEEPPRLVCLYQSDLSAAAGPVSYLEEASGEMVYLYSDELTKMADEIIQVSGDSMEPTFHSGEMVLVQHRDHLNEGEIGIFVNASSGYIKEYRKDGLYSHNPKYAPIRFSSEDSVRCVGKVLGVLSPWQRASEEDIARFTEYRM